LERTAGNSGQKLGNLVGQTETWEAREQMRRDVLAQLRELARMPIADAPPLRSPNPKIGFESRRLERDGRKKHTAPAVGPVPNRNGVALLRDGRDLMLRLALIATICRKNLPATAWCASSIALDGLCTRPAAYLWVLRVSENPAVVTSRGDRSRGSRACSTAKPFPHVA
jgi:hypothetical protein